MNQLTNNNRPIKKFDGIDFDELHLGCKEHYLFNILRKNGALTRDQLVEISSIPRTTIFDNLKSLIAKDLVEKYERKISVGPGRALVFFESKY